jgi:mRNA interferase MazF
MHRGDVWDADLPQIGPHPVVIISRETAIPVLRSLVCALVTSSVHGHLAEVELNADEGLDHASAVNCDNLLTVRKEYFGRRRGALGPARVAQLDTALGIALGLR